MDKFNRHLNKLSFLTPLLLAALVGIVGNRADAIFLVTLSWAGREMPIKIWLLEFLLIFALFLSIIFSFKLYQANRISKNLIDLDESILRLLASFKRTFNSSGFNLFRNSNPEAQKALSLLIEELLEKALEVFYLFHTCGIEVWMSETESGEYLKLWYQANLSDTARARIRFYIGSIESQEKQYIRGLAGKTYRDKKIRTVHIYKKDGVWQADSPDYTFINNRQNYKRFPYRTLIAVPILTELNSGGGKCSGVLCMYSREKRAFDSKRVKSLVASIAERIAYVLIITESKKP